MGWGAVASPLALCLRSRSSSPFPTSSRQIVERERANDLDAESETEPSGGEESGSDEADGSGRQGGTQQRVGGLVALASGMDKAKPGAATGTAYCFACHTTPCSFKPYLDVHSAAQRRLQLEQEMQRLEALPEGVKWVESDVPLSVRHGGPRRQLRMDVVLELDKEQQRLGQQLRLHEVDQELHGVFASRAEYVEVLSLHGYAQMMWRLDAISALEGERSRLLARTAAVEVVDDVLEWMLEGWHFGERESSLPMLGFVPSVRPDGPIQVHHARSQQLVAAGRRRDQARKEEAGREAAAEAVAARSGGKTSALALLGAEEEEGAEAKAKGREVGGVFLPPPPGGSGDGQALVQRWAPLAAVANARAQVGQLAQRREERTALVDQTENTLKFGLFMLVFMFFRSMTVRARPTAHSHLPTPTRALPLACASARSLLTLTVRPSLFPHSCCDATASPSGSERRWRRSWAAGRRARWAGRRGRGWRRRRRTGRSGSGAITPSPQLSLAPTHHRYSPAIRAGRWSWRRGVRPRGRRGARLGSGRRPRSGGSGCRRTRGGARWSGRAPPRCELGAHRRGGPCGKSCRLTHSAVPVGVAAGGRVPRPPGPAARAWPGGGGGGDAGAEGAAPGRGLHPSARVARLHGPAGG